MLEHLVVRPAGLELLLFPPLALVDLSLLLRVALAEVEDLLGTLLGLLDLFPGLLLFFLEKMDSRLEQLRVFLRLLARHLAGCKRGDLHLLLVFHFILFNCIMTVIRTRGTPLLLRPPSSSPLSPLITPECHHYRSPQEYPPAYPSPPTYHISTSPWPFYSRTIN